MTLILKWLILIVHVISVMCHRRLRLGQRGHVVEPLLYYLMVESLNWACEWTSDTIIATVLHTFTQPCPTCVHWDYTWHQWSVLSLLIVKLCLPLQEGRNALYRSAVTGHLAVAQYLAPKMGNHLFDTDAKGCTALHMAANSGHVAIVEYFVRSCGFDVNARDEVR